MGQMRFTVVDGGVFDSFGTVRTYLYNTEYFVPYDYLISEAH